MDDKRRFIINEERRQHISLSNRGMNIIERDMIYFNKDYNRKNKSGFLNRVFQNYYLDFPLAPTLILKNVEKIYGTLIRDDEGKGLVAKIVEIYSTDIMKSSIEEYKNMYESKVPFKLKLNNTCAGILEDFEEACYFEDYAPRSGISFYLKMVFESYASLSRREREKIYYKDQIEIINKAITNNRKVIIKTDNKSKTILPYSLDGEPGKQNHTLSYLTPMDEIELGAPIGINPDILSLSKITGVKLHKLYNNTEGAIVAMMKQNRLKHDIMPHHKSAKNKLKVKIKFTQDGLRRFNMEEDEISIIGLPIENEKDTYLFNATESEIFWHIFKYGSHAGILEPLSLRNKFQAFYKDAYTKYNQKIDNKKEKRK